MDELRPEPEHGPVGAATEPSGLDGAGTPDRRVADEAAHAHGIADVTATDGASGFTDPAPTVGAAAYLGVDAGPENVEVPPVEFHMPGQEPDEGAPATTLAAGSSASAPRPGPGWVVVALVAAVIGGLLGAGLVAVLDQRDETRSTTATFARNTSSIAKPQDIQGILERVQPGVVSIKTQAFQRGAFGDAIPAAGAGTGMIITSDGDVLTNAHVVRGATSIQVTLSNEKDPRFADLVGSDPAADVAVIKIRDVHDLPTVRLGSSARLRVGDDVLAIGNALALPGGPSVTEGIVSAKDRSIGAEDEQLEGLIQTDAAINPGNSGGPLVNADGEVVGMNTAVIQSTGQSLAQNIGFAIAIDNIKPLLERLKKGEGGVVASRAFIGVQTQTMTSEIKDRYGFSVDKGAIVTDVTPGSPAENAGLQQGDVITKFGDQKIESADELVAAVRARKPGDRVEATFTRGREEHKVTVTVGARPGTTGD
ncbi:MAG: serine protease Do [Acidimicrobiaceae bacterium]|nr:serine protease Do [Acidimicrobiaceae bacterium]